MPIDAAKKIPHWWCCPALSRPMAGQAKQLELFTPGSAREESLSLFEERQ
jgi:hypothetical protein